jgi:hypothetical protein
VPRCYSEARHRAAVSVRKSRWRDRAAPQRNDLQGGPRLAEAWQLYFRYEKDVSGNGMRSGGLLYCQTKMPKRPLGLCISAPTSCEPRGWGQLYVRDCRHGWKKTLAL